MIHPTTFRRLVSGERRGIGPRLLRSTLRIAEFPYSWITSIRNRRFDSDRADIYHAEAPVISVGNLTVGGTGKTPMVEWIARSLRAHDLRTAILSRGYGAERGEKNDEALELELALPDVPHLQNPDRVAEARLAVNDLESQVLLLDDGFQHRRLARDFDLVLLDASAPFGYGHQLPRGLLRESPRGLQRAHAVVLSRAELLDEQGRAEVRRRVEQLAPDALWGEVIHQPTGLLSSSGALEAAAQLQGKRIAAFCGIGNPAAFRTTLSGLGAEVIAWKEFPDHHNYDRADVDSLAAWAGNSGAEMVVCTRKDLVKLRVETLNAIDLTAVAVEVRFLCGEPDLTDAILRVARLTSESGCDANFSAKGRISREKPRT